MGICSKCISYFIQLVYEDTVICFILHVIWGSMWVVSRSHIFPVISAPLGQFMICILFYFCSSCPICDIHSFLFQLLMAMCAMYDIFCIISAPHGQYMTCILCYFSSSWACVQCKAPYDMDEIEDTLLDAIHRKSMAFILQDLKCVKCNGVRYFIIRHKMNRLAIIANDSFSCIHVYILNIQGFSSHCKFYEMGKIC